MAAFGPPGHYVEDRVVLRDVGDPSPRPRRNKLTSATGEQIGHHPVQTNDKPSKHVLENVKMVKAAWDTVMNPEQNPLLQLPKVVRFQLMAVLAFMWSCIFCISAGMFMWIPEFVFGHVLLLLIGIFGTGYIFRVQNQ